MSRYLLADIGSTFTKLCVADTDSATVIAQASAPTTVATDVNAGFNAARRRLQYKPDKFDAILACSSAAGGLRIAATGLVPQLTMTAARQAALGAGGKVTHTCAYNLTATDIAELRRCQPDIILLAGGTDGGDSGHILKNAGQLQRHLPDIPVIVAGNRAAYDELREVFAARDNVVFTENVMPEINRLNLEPARACIREMFLRRIVQARGLDRLQATAQILMPTPEAVLRAARLLAEGAPRDAQSGLGELLLIDMGGATTDVYSCARGAPESPQTVVKGLPEPFVKRTVEADIGMRHTSRFLTEQPDLPDMAMEAGITVDVLQNWIATVENHPDRLPVSPVEQAADTALARAGGRLAAARHAGRLEECFTPAGRTYVQEGKDLSGVKVLIGSGGAMVNNPDPAGLLAAARRRPGDAALTPRAPDLFVDHYYILWAAGLLAETDARAALHIMRNSLLQPQLNRTGKKHGT